MKKHIVIAALSYIISFPTFAQWSNNNNSETTTSRSVGVGTTNPQYGKLEIAADSHEENALRLKTGKFSMNGTAEFQIDAPGTHGGRFVVNQDGEVGIGSSTPSEKLEVRNGNILVGNSNEGGGKIYLGNSNHGLIRQGNVVSLFSAGNNGGISFIHRNWDGNGYNNWDTSMYLDNDGNVGIGTEDPQNKLSVNGTLWAKEIKCSLNDAADWVFEESYDLRSLEEVESYVKDNKHLPDVPSAEEFKENDMNVAEMNNTLLQKIEELTLYMIDMNKRMKEIEEENSTLKEKVSTLESN